MSLDQATHIGAYAICTQDVLTTADNDGPLVEGAVVFISNGGSGTDIRLEPYESLKPTSIPNQEKSIAEFKDKFSDCLNRMCDDWRTVEVKFGVLSYVW